MSADLRGVRGFFRRLFDERTLPEIEQSLLPTLEDMALSVPRGDAPGTISPEEVERRWDLLDTQETVKHQLLDDLTREQMILYQKNIENFIGTVKVPIGLAGPLRVRGLFANGDYYVPLATSEAALVASYSRGAHSITKAGGATVAMMWEGVTRAPVFVFDNLIEVGKFMAWACEQTDIFKDIAASTTRYGKLLRTCFNVEGNHVYLIFEFVTGDASGQNMVTIATDAVCRYILDKTPAQPAYWFVEANHSGDKKASHMSFQNVRGKKVIAEVTLSPEILQHYLKTTATKMTDYYQAGVIGGVMSGNIGLQGHYANGMAALFIACGQDAACVSESSVGITRMERIDGDCLYASVTLPNLIVGTVGGGTGLPSQKACLDILKLSGAGNASALAEVCAALVLAGELSISAALTSHGFTNAHESLARGPKKKSS